MLDMTNGDNWNYMAMIHNMTSDDHKNDIALMHDIKYGDD